MATVTVHRHMAMVRNEAMRILIALGAGHIDHSTYRDRMTALTVPMPNRRPTLNRGK